MSLRAHQMVEIWDFLSWCLTAACKQAYCKGEHTVKESHILDAEATKDGMYTFTTPTVKPNVSSGPLARPFARSFAFICLLTGLLARSLTHSLTSGKMYDLIAIFPAFFLCGPWWTGVAAQKSCITAVFSPVRRVIPLPQFLGDTQWILSRCTGNQVNSFTWYHFPITAKKRKKNDVRMDWSFVCCTRNFLKKIKTSRTEFRQQMRSAIC